ncbi:MAG TPA: sensor histidine kinase [Sandaracinaceae bacterium LLY-WYZ-13_1]|nr:sensor histidine kinase [Sandaracinaceae bacterium LLY-WYZ-13_1]
MSAAVAHRSGATRWWDTLRAPFRRWLVDASAAEVRPDGFGDFARRLSLRNAQIGALVWAVSAIGFWPTDLFVLAPRARAIFAVSRPVTAGVAIVAFFVLSWLRHRPGLAYPAVAFFGAAITVPLGAFKAQIGGLEGQWFYFSFFIPWCGLLVVAPPGSRIGVTLAVTLGYPLAFFTCAPQELGKPQVGSSIVFLLFATGASVIVGHMTYRLVRADYRLRSSLEWKIAERTEVLAKLAERLEDSREHERRVVSRELHDETAQLLTGMRLELSLMRRTLGEGHEAQALIDRLTKLVEQSFDAHRSIIAALRPRILDELGLVAAVRQQVDRLRAHEHLEVGFETDDERYDLDERSALAVFRAVQEALTNVVRHAEASRVDVRLRRDGSRVRAEITDDGRGFDPSAQADGFGLLGLRERLRALDGTFEVDSARGRGTRLALAVPERPVGDA